MTDDLADEQQQLLETFTEGTELDPDTADQALQVQYNLDVRDMSDEDAREMRERFEEGDIDAVCEMLREYDVPDHLITQFKHTVSSDSTANEDGGDGTEDDQASTDADTGGQAADVSADDVQQMISDEVARQTPNADEIAAQLKQQMGGGQAQAPPQGGGEGGQNAQQQMAMQLAQAFLQSQQSTASPFAQMGEQMAKMSMYQMAERMHKPSLGEMIGESVEKNLAEQFGAQISNDVSEQLPEGVDPDEFEMSMPWEDDDEDDDSGSGWF